VSLMVPLARFRRPVKVSDSSQTWLRRRIAAHRGGDQPRKQGGQMEPAIEITAGRGEVASRMIAPFDRAIAPPTYAHHERLFSRRSATGPAAVALAPAASPTKLPETNPTTRGFAPGQGLHLFVLARPRRRAGRVSMTRPLQPGTTVPVDAGHAGPTSLSPTEWHVVRQRAAGRRGES